METNNIIARMQAEIDAASAECVRLAEVLKHVQGENGKLMGEIAARDVAADPAAKVQGIATELYEFVKAMSIGYTAEHQGSEHCAVCGVDLDDGAEHRPDCLTIRARAYLAEGSEPAREVPPLPAPSEPQKQTDLSQRLRDMRAFGPGDFALLDKAADEIDRLTTAKSHLIQEAQIWHGEAKCQHSIVIDILRHFELPENDWEALRLIVHHIAKLSSAPAPAPSKAAEGSIGDDEQFNALLNSAYIEWTASRDSAKRREFIAYIDSRDRKALESYQATLDGVVRDYNLMQAQRDELIAGKAAEGSIGDEGTFLFLLANYGRAIVGRNVSDGQDTMDALVAYIDSWTTARIAAAGRLTDEQREVLTFLDGSGPLEGMHFGDSDASKPRPRLWWRKNLREAFAPLTAQVSGQPGAADGGSQA
jgi:hypothetical protein